MRAILLILIALILNACAGAPSGGSGGTAYQANFDARLADKSKFGKVIIAPVNFGKPSRSYLAEHEQRIDALVEKRLSKAGYKVLPASLFETAWRDGVRKWGEPYNPTTGKLNETAFQYVLSETVRALASSTEVQAIVFTNLEELQVYFSPSGGHVAHFLGVTRKPASRGGDGVPGGFDWVQGVDAVGLYINVFDMELKRLFNGAGGIEVTETLDLKGSYPRWTRSKKTLDNEDFIEEGMDLALRPWISSK